jgi:NAD+ synthase (glutamine-hydrolysing)
MPTQFNSQTTRALAKICAVNFRVTYRVVPIQKLYELQVATLLQDMGYESMPTLVKENIQARIRGQQLASIAAMEGGVFTNNGNKTEMALNYFTLYGDGAGAASFLGDLWKGQVYELANLVNDKAGYDKIPRGIIAIPPSAELSEGQNVDEGKGDPIFYPYHDALLRAFMEWRWDPAMILVCAIAGTLENDLGCVAGTINRFFPSRQAFVDNLEWAWRQYNIEFKRVQLPPVFLASKRAFGFDRRETIADAYFVSGYEDVRSEYLNQR